MSGRGDFDFDLKEGLARESAFVQAVSAARVEHKQDRHAIEHHNGKLAIEIGRLDGRPSGLNVTTAEWWAHEVQHDTWVVVRTSLLRELVAYAIADGRTVIGKSGQDLVLLPIEWVTVKKPW